MMAFLVSKLTKTAGLVYRVIDIMSVVIKEDVHRGLWSQGCQVSFEFLGYIVLCVLPFFGRSLT